MTSSTLRVRWSPLVGSLLAGYVVGLFPSADLAAHLTGRDGEIRRAGSRNPGATNAAKVLGRTWGAAVLAADVAKGATGAGLGRLVAQDRGAAAGGIGAVLGHCFPLGRRGGKGVASRYGALALLAPEVAVIDLTAAALVTNTTRRPGTAMAVAIAVSGAVGGALLRRRTPERRAAGLALATVSGAVVLFRFAQERTDEDGAPTAE